MLAARLTSLDDAITRQPLAHSAPPMTICQPLDGTPGWSLGLADQAQVYHHLTKRAKTLAPHVPEGLMRHAHVTHR
jgi:hypothetical protein